MREAANRTCAVLPCTAYHTVERTALGCKLLLFENRFLMAQRAYDTLGANIARSLTHLADES